MWLGGWVGAEGAPPQVEGVASGQVSAEGSLGERCRGCPISATESPTLQPTHPPTTHTHSRQSHHTRRQVQGLPIYAVGNASVEGLRRLLGQLGATPGGSTHVIITDLRCVCMLEGGRRARAGGAHANAASACGR